MKIAVSESAVTDIARLRAFLKDNPPATVRAVNTLVKAIQSLEILPERGRQSAIANVRELIVPFGRSVYVLRYLHTPRSEEVVILRIWHGREARE